MDKLDFVVPVRLVPHPDEPVTEIYNLDEALTFLQNWEGDQESQVFQMTLDHCLGAKVDLYTTEDARRALAGFCRITGIASRDTPQSFVIDLDGEVRAHLSQAD
jgi:hypothetical protein